MFFIFKGNVITGFVIRVPRRLPLMVQELPTLPEHPSSPPIFSAVRICWALFFVYSFVNRCLPFCPFSLCCMSVFNLCILIAPLVYSNSSYDELLLKYYICNKQTTMPPPHGRWFSPVSSTTKTGRHDIAEILLKMALNTKNQINQASTLSEKFC